jgi:putative phage-type endonuclease
MIISHSKQGEPEWFAEHLGRPSASEFAKIITTTGSPSKQRKKYLYQKAAETVSGIMENTYESPWMARGKVLEAEARALYEFNNEVTVQEVGCCFRDKKKDCLCSPDGLVGDDGGLEIKCPSQAVHAEYLEKKKLPTDYFCQVQGSLWITGRDWWHFCSYSPGMRFLQIKVTPNLEWMRLLAIEINRFNTDLKQLVREIA